MNQSRRIVLMGALSGFTALVLGSKLNAQPTQKKSDQRRVIKIQAQRYFYTPNRITIKKGEQVTLELTALDFMHGFSLPDFKIRTDIPPGQGATIQLNPEKEGEFVFLCDNFCGTGHEGMNGKIIVTA